LKSLPKISTDPRSTIMHGYAREFVCVDEVDRCMHFAFSGLTERPSTTLNYLLRVSATSRLTAVMSADLTDDLIDKLKRNLARLNPKLQFVTVRQKPNQATPQRRIRYVNLGFAKDRFYAAVDEHKPGSGTLVLCTTSKGEPEVLARAIKKRRKKLKVAWVSSSNSRLKWVQENLRCPDELTKDADVLIVSPSVQSGVSFDMPVKRVFMWQSFRAVSAQVCCQMVMRFRKVEDPVIVWGACNWQAEGSLPTDEATLKQHASEGAEKTHKLLRRACIDYDLDDRLEMVPQNPLVLDMWCFVQAQQNAMENDPVGETLAAMRRHGWRVAHDDFSEPHPGRLKAWKDPREKAKSECKKEHVEAVVKAERMTKQEMDRVEAQTSLTFDEQNSIEKTKIVEFYGNEKPDAELVERDDNGKWRRALSIYNDARAVRDEHLRRYVVFQDVRASEGASKAELKHRTRKAELRAQILDRLEGYRLEDGTVEIHQDELHRIAMDLWTEHGDEFKKLLRSQLKREDRAVLWFNGHVRKMGGQTDFVKSTDDKRRYYMSWRQAEKDAAHQWAEIVAGADRLRDNATAAVV